MKKNLISTLPGLVFLLSNCNAGNPGKTGSNTAITSGSGKKIPEMPC